MTTNAYLQERIDIKLQIRTFRALSFMQGEDSICSDPAHWKSDTAVSIPPLGFTRIRIQYEFRDMGRLAAQHQPLPNDYDLQFDL